VSISRLVRKKSRVVPRRKREPGQGRNPAVGKERKHLALNPGSTWLLESIGRCVIAFDHRHPGRWGSTERAIGSIFSFFRYVSYGSLSELMKTIDIYCASDGKFEYLSPWFSIYQIWQESKREKDGKRKRQKERKKRNRWSVQPDGSLSLSRGRKRGTRRSTTRHREDPVKAAPSGRASRISRGYVNVGLVWIQSV